MTADSPTPRATRRRVHLARLVSPTGAVSPACAREPRAINMQRDTWSTDPSAVTCRSCLKAAADRDPPTPRDPEFETERLRAALQRIKAECGRVCATFELCTHVACQSSVAAWMIADAALKGETPESANTKFGSGNQSLPQEAFGGPAAADRARPKEQP